MSGGKSTTTYAPKLNGIQIQSSVYGSAITRGWGTFRCAPTLLWYGDFQAIAVRSQTRAGGKGGGGATQTNVTYNYKAALMLGICAGPINSIRTIYKDKAVFGSMSAVGLSLATGAIGQAVWGHLSTRHPSEAIGYSGIAYAYSASYDLSEQATIGNHSFEVVTNARVSGKDDCNPKQIIEEALGMVQLFPDAALGDLTDWGNYCLAAGLLLSPVLDSQVRAADFLSEILKATNSDCYTSGGKLKVFSYGDTAVTGNSVTWTPNLAPVYALSDDDFIADPGQEAVSIDISRGADAFNVVQIGYLDRANQYNAQVMPGTDSASIDQHGERKADVEKLHCICDAGVAKKVADLRVQRTANMRATYHFRLPDEFGLLEPSDLVTLTTGDLNGVLVRLTRIDENTAEGTLECEAEEMLVGAGSTTGGTTQDTDGYRPDYEVDPGDATDPVVVNPPRQLTNGAYEAWIGLTGGDNWGGAEVWTSLDGDTYQLMGRVESKARFGVTTSAMSAVADPDSTTVLGVNMAASHGELNGATQAEVDAFANLAMIGTEVVAFRDAVLTGADAYNLDYFRRGLFGTTPAAHASGQSFVRLDEALYVFPYRSDQIGTSVYVKFRSFNVYGRGYQDLDTLDEYLFTLTPSGAYYTQVDWDDTTPPGPDTLDDWNVLRRTGGGSFIGDLAATRGARAGTNLYRTDGTTVLNQAEVRTAEGTAAGFTGQTDWATYSTHTAANIAPRVAAGLDASGDLARNIPSSRLDSSNVLRRSGGGLSTADLDATRGARSGTNLYRTDGTTVLSQAEIRTAEGTAAGFTGQGPWATLADAVDTVRTPGVNLVKNPTGAQGKVYWNGATANWSSYEHPTFGWWFTRYGASYAGTISEEFYSDYCGIAYSPSTPIVLQARPYLAGLTGGQFKIEVWAYHNTTDAVLGVVCSIALSAGDTTTGRRVATGTTPSGVICKLRVVVSLASATFNTGGYYEAGFFKVKLETGLAATVWTLDSTQATNWGSIAGLNLRRTDGTTVLSQAEVRTAEGTAAAITGQSLWATYSTHTPANIAPRVAAGLDSNGDLARNIPSSRLDSSNALRRSGGGLFTGETNADRTQDHVASGISGQSDWATATDIPTDRLQYVNDNGRLADGRAFPYNLASAMGGAMFNPEYPLSSLSTTEIEIAATVITYPAGYQLTVGGATITGLTANTLYAIVLDLDTSTFLAVTSGITTYAQSVDRYVMFGSQRTQQTGGGFSPPPPLPPGGGGGPSRPTGVLP